MIIKLAQRGAFTDSLTEILRSGERALLTQAVEAEAPSSVARGLSATPRRGLSGTRARRRCQAATPQIGC